MWFTRKHVALPHIYLYFLKSHAGVVEISGGGHSPELFPLSSLSPHSLLSPLCLRSAPLKTSTLPCLPTSHELPSLYCGVLPGEPAYLSAFLSPLPSIPYIHRAPCPFPRWGRVVCPRVYTDEGPCGDALCRGSIHPPIDRYIRNRDANSGWKWRHKQLARPSKVTMNQNSNDGSTVSSPTRRFPSQAYDAGTHLAAISANCFACCSLGKGML